MIINFIADTKKKIGFGYNDDPSELSFERLIEVGKAVSQAHDSVVGGESARVAQGVIQTKIEAIQDTESFREDFEAAKNETDNINTIGYDLAHYSPDRRTKLGKQQYALNVDVMGKHVHAVFDIAEKHEGELRHLWLQYADQAKRLAHYWLKHDYELRVWRQKLVDEYKKRKGIEDKRTLQEMMEDEAGGFKFEDLDLSDVEPDEYTDEQIEIMHLEDALRERDAEYRTVTRAFDRLSEVLDDTSKSSDEKVAELQADIKQIQQNSMNRKFWKPDEKETARLLKEIDPSGKWLKLGFHGNSHFKRNLMVRYNVDLMNRDECRFFCSKLSHDNCYFGYFQGYEDIEVVVALKISGKNKPQAGVPNFDSEEALEYYGKTVLMNTEWAAEYLKLEIKYCTYSADYEGYSQDDLRRIGARIQTELNELKKKWANGKNH